MKSNFDKLGNYIIQRKEKNTSTDLPICGVCREGLIPPKQQDADISLYNVFYKNDFIFNPARMELNSITLNRIHEKAICSSLYEIFYIKDFNLLLPEYLYVQLKKEDFIRFCKFVGQGSVREYCRFSNISDYPIYVPSIEEQKKIVEQYNVLQQRIEIKKKINNDLSHYGQLLFKENFINRKNANKALLNELISFTKGKKPENIQNNRIDNYDTYLTIEALTTNKKQFASKEKTVIADELDVLMVMDGASSCEVFSSKKGIVGSTLAKINFITPTIKESIFQFLKYNKEEYQNRNADTAIPHADKDFILQQEITIPENLQELENQFYTIRSSIYKNDEQILYLQELQELIGNKISN